MDSHEGTPEMEPIKNFKADQFKKEGKELLIKNHELAALIASKLAEATAGRHEEPIDLKVGFVVHRNPS